MKLLIPFLPIMVVGAASAALPIVSDVTISQGEDRAVTISYKLANEPAIVTVDVQTNDGNGAWISIGGANMGCVSGDAMRRIEPGEAVRRATWLPDRAWTGNLVAAGGARAVVTPWPTNDTPDYLVVDISGCSSDRVRYYPSVEWIPGGLLNDPSYRMSKLVLKRIRSKGVTWQMGTTADRWGVPWGTNSSDGMNGGLEAAHEVTLDHDYYIGVFELTQAQWAVLQETARGCYFKLEKAMRPVDSATYCSLREGKASDWVQEPGDWSYPNEPYPGSILGILRDRTKLDFDLPSEAEWEFAARGGHGDGFWGDGNPIAYGTGTYGSWTWDGQLNARYGAPEIVSCPEIRSSVWEENFTVGADRGTAVVGSYPPNGHGLYDMAGNVYEWCLDWYKADISTLNGGVNTTAERNERIVRGGSQYCSSGAVDCRPSRRLSCDPAKRAAGTGARAVCRAGLN